MRRKKTPQSLRDHKPVPTARRCPVCDGVLDAYSRRKFCSFKCVGVSRRSRIYTCIICRKDFEPRTRNEDTRRQTCGPACKKVVISFNSSRLRSKRHTATAPCPICGTIFKVYDRAKHKRTACSRACAVKLSWRGGRKPVDYSKFKRNAQGDFIK